MPGSPSKALRESTNVLVARTSSTPKRKHVDGVGAEAEERQKGPKGGGLQFGDMEAIDMAGVKADGMAVDEKGANNVSAGGVGEDADRAKEGGRTTGGRGKEYEAVLNKIQAAQCHASKDASSIQPPPPRLDGRGGAHGDGAEGGAPARRDEPSVSLNSLNSSSGKGGAESPHSAEGSPVLALGKKDTHVAHGAHGVGAEAEDLARRGESSVSLNSLNSSSGKGGFSSSGSAGPALDKKDTHGADVAHGSDDDEVIHRGRGRRKLDLTSDNEGSAVESGGKTGGKTTGEGAESDDLQNTDSEGESTSHAGHCAILGIAHNAPKNEIKEAYKLAL